MERPLIRFIQNLPKGSIRQTGYLFLPSALFGIGLVMFYGSLPWLQKTLWLCLGLSLWTLMEYIVHRFVFHWRPESEVGQAIIGRLHVIHHNDPKDTSQVCIPFYLAVPYWGIFYFLLQIPLGAEQSLIVTLGAAFMMSVYDVTHYATHYWDHRNKLFKALKRHHLRHHYGDATKLFGVTSPFWDHVFGTYR